MDKVIYRSPLATKTPDDKLREITDLALVNLRGRGDAFMKAAEEELGAALPIAPNTTISVGKRIIFWLGPDEWLVRDTESAAATKIVDWAAATSAAAAVLVSDYYTVIGIGGARAKPALATACPLDLDILGVGQCAQSHFGQAAIMIYCCDNTPNFELLVRWSFADYVWEYLRAASKE